MIAEVYYLSLHDALPILRWNLWASRRLALPGDVKMFGNHRRMCIGDRKQNGWETVVTQRTANWRLDRKSTRLNSSHMSISYAVFCLKKKKQYSVRTYFAS